MEASVVITGIGAVTPAGLGTDALTGSLETGAQPLSQVDVSHGLPRESSARTAGLLGEQPYGDWLNPREARRMSPASRMAVCAAAMALDDAGLERDAVEGTATGVCMGTTFGSTSYTTKLLEQINGMGPCSISPLLFMETVANAHAGQIALAWGARGPNYTISQREASGTLAVARGADLIASGRVERVLVGSVDEVSPTQHLVLDHFNALARSDQDGVKEVARVFDKKRAGFIASEGGTVLVLESEEGARARGARIRSRLRLWARGNDPTATATDWGRGHEHLSGLLGACLEQKAVPVATIDRVVSCASGSRRGDLLEGLTLKGLFGDQLPPILAPKSVTGEYGGGFLASTLLGLGPIRWAPPPGFEVPDPAMCLSPHDGTPLPPAERILVTSLSAGGAAAWLVLERVGEV